MSMKWVHSNDTYWPFPIANEHDLSHAVASAVTTFLGLKMSSVQDIVTSLTINSATSVALIAAYAILKNQPINTRVYFAKWVKMGAEAGPVNVNPKGRRIGRYINLNLKTYAHVMDWIRSSLRMPEAELIEHAGLDSAIYLRMLLLGIQIFVPMMVYSFVVLVPINVTDEELVQAQRGDTDFTYSSLDTITISNIQNKSTRLWAHLIAAYVYTAWTCFLLFRLYRSLVTLRFTFIASQERRPDEFTVLCRCIPEDPDEPVKLHVDHFFRVNHPDYYLLNSVVYNANKLSNLVEKKENYKNKVLYVEGVIARATSPNRSRPSKKKGFLGLWGERVDKLDYYTQQVAELTEKIRNERIRLLDDPKSVMPAAFVSFETRWAAAVCSQTKQSKDSSKWLTQWAPEPRDVFWANLPVPYLQLNSRRLFSAVLLALMVVFFLLPVAFVQSLANLDKIERNVSFLKPLIEIGLIKSVLQGFLPGLSLKLFLAVLPTVVWYLAVFEGHVSYSKIEKHACINYLLFMLVNVFLGNVVTGSAFEQLKLFLETPTDIPSVLGKAIAQRAPFFITYVLVDGWTNTAAELVRVFPFLLYHFKNATMVRTERDRDRATPVGFIRYTIALPRLGLYFLLGFVYSTISPLILPFILVYLGAAYVVYRNQVINAYDQRYESSGAYWPVMFAYAIIGLLVMHATLIGVMALKHAAASTPFLIPLPICTILFWYYCKSRFEEGFRCYPLEEAKAKDTIEMAREPDLDRREFLEGAYMHPTLRAAFLDGDIDESDSEAAVAELLHSPHVFPSRRNSNESSSSRGASAHKNHLFPEPSSPNRPTSSGSSTPMGHGIGRTMQESIPSGKESSSSRV